ncbi:hypothetical protein STRDD11_02150 [Streptococcus sp. DD11]|nr:hypothetical protein STRDD11_02150 [Streptococcus sp. DD11]
MAAAIRENGLCSAIQKERCFFLCPIGVIKLLGKSVHRLQICRRHTGGGIRLLPNHAQTFSEADSILSAAAQLRVADCRPFEQFIYSILHCQTLVRQRSISKTAGISCELLACRRSQQSSRGSIRIRPRPVLPLREFSRGCCSVLGSAAPVHLGRFLSC